MVKCLGCEEGTEVGTDDGGAIGLGDGISIIRPKRHFLIKIIQIYARNQDSQRVSCSRHRNDRVPQGIG